MKTRVVAISACFVVSAAAVAWAWRRGGSAPLGPWEALGLVTAGLFAAVGLLTLRSAISGSRPARALMRLDWYLPSLRKGKGAASPSAPSTTPVVLPRGRRADRESKDPGRVRKALQWMGRATLASPGRRAVQAICFVLFVVLFFYVCWPYSARPAAPGEISSGWKFAELVQPSGDLRFAREAPAPASFQIGRVVHVVSATPSTSKTKASCAGLQSSLRRARAGRTAS